MVEARVYVVGKLYFYYWFETHGIHTHRRAHYVRLLNGHVEHTVVTEFVCQCGRFAEHTAQAPAYILPVKKGIGVVLQYFFHGMQCGIHHHYFFAAGGAAVTCLVDHRSWYKNVI